MCKYKRKYESYIIKITYLNGETEEIQYKGINTSNYKDMRNLYNQTKEEFKNQSVVISFLGKTVEGELHIKWQKELKGKELKEKEKAEKADSTPIKDILKNIKNSLELLNEKKDLAYVNRDKYSKDSDNDLHNLEEFRKREKNGEYFSPRFKCKFYEELGDKRLMRREAKKDIEKINNLSNLLQWFKNINTKEELDVDSLIKMMNHNLVLIEKIDNKKYKILNKHTLKELKIMRRKKYKNNKERDRLINKFKRAYDKVKYDKSKMEIICYNKAKAV